MFLAEGVRFELTRTFQPYRISSAAHSSTLAPLLLPELINVDPRGIEPRTPPCHGGVLPVYYGPACP